MNRHKTLTHDLRNAKGLVIDGNPTTRSILVSQLRDIGLSRVSQSPRIGDARRQLEFTTFDIVVCEQHFSNDNATGQGLLDDLRRSGLLPFATIFIMVTAEASYAKVAEAAESALDSYLLKPYTAARLEERIFQARRRKVVLQDIFQAIQAQDFQTAAQQCLKRFEERGEYWLYAARVGAELLLRLDQYDAAQKLYEAVIAAKTLPWARLGIARAQLEAGQTQKAVTTLEGLISSDPGYTDAYDVLGRAQIELGNFDAALATYKMATDTTPSSIGRLQRHGMLAHYCGDTKIAEEMLSRAVRLGSDSKIFDAQALVLLGFIRFEAGDRRNLMRCVDDARSILNKNESSLRLQRLLQILELLALIMEAQVARVLASVRTLMQDILDECFDFEAACNLLTVFGIMAQRSIQIDEVDEAVRVLGMRFCTSNALTQLLVQSARSHDPYAQSLQKTQVVVMQNIEQAVRKSLAGNPRAAVIELSEEGALTRNAKIIESAWAVLKRYESRIEDASRLAEVIQPLRSRFMSYANKVAIGDKSQRQSGGVSLRVMDVKTD